MRLAEMRARRKITARLAQLATNCDVVMQAAGKQPPGEVDSVFHWIRETIFTLNLHIDDPAMGVDHANRLIDEMHIRLAQALSEIKQGSSEYVQ